MATLDHAAGPLHRAARVGPPQRTMLAGELHHGCIVPIGADQAFQAQHPCRHVAQQRPQLVGGQRMRGRVVPAFKQIAMLGGPGWLEGGRGGLCRNTPRSRDEQQRRAEQRTGAVERQQADDPTALSCGENFIVHREGPEATPYLPNVIVSSNPLVRPNDYGIPLDADLVFDVRCLPNPHYDPILRPQTGCDQPVIDYLERSPDVLRMRDDIARFVHDWLPCYIKDSRSYLTVAIGCTGGQHRSVYMTQWLAEHFRKEARVLLRHRSLASSGK